MIAGVRDLQACDGCLDGWNFCGEAGLADGLTVAESSHFGGDDLVGGKGGVGALDRRRRLGPADPRRATRTSYL